jgi:type II secretory pathway pseudopilin PulG
MREHAPIRLKPRLLQDREGEQGYILIAVIFMLAIFVIALSIAMPKVIKEIQRDREIETMHRGKQYIRALKLYYRKFGAYPPKADALIKTNEIRFLRKKYIDPTTGKDEWKPILYGQNKAPTALGFFGVPIAGSTLAGIGPSGGNRLGASALGSSGLGTNPASATPDNSTDPSASAPDASASGTSDASAQGANATVPTASTGPGAGLGGQTGSGQTFGGAGIIGFSPGSPKQSILVYKKKKHYNEWEFVYDPIADQMMQGGNIGAIGQPASSTTTPIGINPSSPAAPFGANPGQSTPPPGSSPQQ